MENTTNINEQTLDTTTAVTVATATKNDNSDKNSIGKFRSKEDLLEAYNSLEAEFTRRSQKIKELENLVNTPQPSSKWEAKVADLTKQYPVAGTLSSEITDYIASNKELLDDDNCLEKALLNVLATRVEPVAIKSAAPETAKTNANSSSQVTKKEDIISEYINSLRGEIPAVTPKGGEIPVSLPRRPQNIAEAGQLAVSIMKNYKK